MSATFDALPGIEVPAGAIKSRLAGMWAEAAAAGGPAPDDATATQVNFVLHLGLNTTDADALVQFRTMLRFSQRYPSRVVVLCPRRSDEGETEIRAKIYGECFLGKSKSDKRCVEFVLLSYPRRARQFLEAQVSICLSTDLPLYYWAHRFSENLKLADYRYLLTRARRVLIDSAIAPPDALTFPWPRPEAVRDLVYARLLPVRQTVGQFLAGYAPAALAGDLQKVTVEHGGELAAEGRTLLAWLRRRLTACSGAVESVPFATQAVETGRRLAIQFDYKGGNKRFRWEGDLGSSQAHFAADFGGARVALPAAVSLLAPEAALSEAMFF